MAKRDIVYQFKTALLLCILHIAGIDVFAQEPNDSIIIAVEEYAPSVDFDSLAVAVDSLGTDSVFISVADSLRQVNDINLEKMEKVENLLDDPEITLLAADSVSIAPEKKCGCLTLTMLPGWPSCFRVADRFIIVSTGNCLLYTAGLPVVLMLCPGITTRTRIIHRHTWTLWIKTPIPTATTIYCRRERQ